MRAIRAPRDARFPRAPSSAGSCGCSRRSCSPPTSSRCFQLAPITHWLWPIPLAFFVVYPYLKRFTWFCHFWLGICLGLGVTGGWAAVGAPLAHPAPWVLGAAVAIWTAGFDIIYATQDYECDVRDGIHSVPADFGIAKGLIVTRWCHAATVVLFALGGYLARR